VIQTSRNLSKNRLLAALPSEEYKRLLPNLESVYLPHGQVIYEPHEPIKYVYFPTDAVMSLINLMEDGAGVEAGTVGNEGMVGIFVFLAGDHSVNQAVTQIPGNAVRMRADLFKHNVIPDSPLYKLLQRYTQALLSQICQSVTSDGLHSIEKRCCRWLLMTQDRVEGNQFPLTQEYLAYMLGVRRASVSEVCNLLQKAGFISYSRGSITILNRQALENTSCTCYAIIKDEFNRLLGGN
jgi:CRP-like cAMP-binding protein